MIEEPTAAESHHSLYSLDPRTLVAVSVILTGFSLLAFLVVTSLEAIGSTVSWRAKREWPFYLGIAVTLLPIALAFVLPEALDNGLGGRAD